MADTVRTPTTLLTSLFQDGQTAGISAQDMRDLIVSVRAPFGRIASNVPSLTTITTQNVFVKAAGTTTFGGMSNQMDGNAVNNRIRYTGPVSRHMHIVLQGSCQFATGTNLTVALQLYHYDDSAASGSLVAHSLARSVVAGANVQQVTSHADLMLDTNDYIELWVANTSGTQDVTVSNVYMFMMGMF